MGGRSGCAEKEQGMYAGIFRDIAGVTGKYRDGSGPLGGEAMARADSQESTAAAGIGSDQSHEPRRDDQRTMLMKFGLNLP